MDPYIDSMADAAIKLLEEGNNHPTSDEITLKEAAGHVLHPRVLIWNRQNILPKVMKRLRKRDYECCQYNNRLEAPHPFYPSTTFLLTPPTCVEEGQICVAGYGRGRNAVGIWFCVSHPDYLYGAARNMALQSGNGKQQINMDAIILGSDKGSIDWDAGTTMMASTADSVEGIFLNAPINSIARINGTRPDVILYRKRRRNIFNPTLLPPEDE